MVLQITETPNDMPEGGVIEQKPNVFSMKAWAINDRPVFYGHEDADQVYCMPDSMWVSKPSYLDYFESREVCPSDMGNLVVHNLLGDEDFNSLNGAGMVDPTLQQIYQKMKELTAKVEELENEAMVVRGLHKTDQSEDSEESSEEESESFEDNDSDDLDDISSSEESEEVGEEDLSMAVSVLQQILDGVRDMDIQEKRLIALLKDRFVEKAQQTEMITGDDSGNNIQ